MINAPNILLIGAAGRNTGKTTFACRVIENIFKDTPLIAAKVTTIVERDGKCPRGGTGCGTCSSLEENFQITQETDSTSNKDTARLLQAGAKKVYWLRVQKDHLKEAAAALLETIGPDTPCVIESNSLRLIVEPSLFIMTKDAGASEYKPSAKDVADLTDIKVSFNGSDFDTNTDDISLHNNKWTLRKN